MAHQGRLARARQPHDHEDLAAADGQREIVDPDHAAGFGQDLILGFLLADQFQGIFGASTEYLEDILDFDLVHCLFGAHLPTPCRGRP
ncbi:hypothetical protein D3C78_516600 [compost metagenome]